MEATLSLNIHLWHILARSPILHRKHVMCFDWYMWVTDFIFGSKWYWNISYHIITYPNIIHMHSLLSTSTLRTECKPCPWTYICGKICQNTEMQNKWQVQQFNTVLRLPNASDRDPEWSEAILHISLVWSILLTVIYIQNWKGFKQFFVQPRQLRGTSNAQLTGPIFFNIVNVTVTTTASYSAHSCPTSLSLVDNCYWFRCFPTQYIRFRMAWAGCWKIAGLQKFAASTSDLEFLNWIAASAKNKEVLLFVMLFCDQESFEWRLSTKTGLRNIHQKHPKTCKKPWKKLVNSQRPCLEKK